MHLIARIIVFLLIILLVEIYFFRRLKKSFNRILPYRHALKRNILIVWGILSIYPLFLIIVWIYSSINKTPVIFPQNSLFNYLILYPFWLTILIVVQCDLSFLILDFLKLVFLPLKKLKTKLLKFESAAVLLITAIFIVYVPINVVYNYNTTQVRTVNYFKKNLPEQLNNFRIAFISDIHADQFTDSKRLQKYVTEVNKLNPDLVLVGGDFISSSPEYIQTAAEYIGKIKSQYGIYSCVGDHDNWAYRNDYKRSLLAIENALNQQNIKMFDNRDEVLNINNAKIDIVFITNTYVEHINRSTLNELTADTAKYDLKILLTHQPHNNVVQRAANTGFDLLLAGHTHGGQITFLFPFTNLTPTMLETRYIRGNFHFGRMLMVVTRGLGMSLVPLRYNSKPEITIINIRKS